MDNTQKLTDIVVIVELTVDIYIVCDIVSGVCVWSSMGIERF